MTANLAMYDLPGYTALLDGLWDVLRDELRMRGIPAPDQMDRATELWEIWRSPDLVLAQTCGLPLRSQLHEHVTLIGTFDYGLPDAPAGYYYSHLITRLDGPDSLRECKTPRLAINGYDSQSGWAAAVEMAKVSGTDFADVVPTGAHVNSIAAVQNGAADIAAIDAVTWRQLAAMTPEVLTSVKIIGQSRPTPSQPLITKIGVDPEPYRQAIRAGLGKLSATDKKTLGLKEFVLLPFDRYAAIPVPPNASAIAAMPSA